MEKVLRSDRLELCAVVGIDPESDGLARARAHGIPASHEGLDWLLARPELPAIAFEATSAAVHAAGAPRLEDAGIAAVDLTPAAVGAPVVPSVNLDDHLDTPNINMITCAGQATVPIVAAIASVADVRYAEIVATIASRSAGPGTRANIDEFTETTAQALIDVGGATMGKAIIVLNPADPPILMRDTVYAALPDGSDLDAVSDAIERQVDEVSQFVPGYRLKQEVLFVEGTFDTPGGPAETCCTVLLEVTGAGDYLPTYAGNLDIMTAAALRVGERLAEHLAASGATR